MIIMMITKLYNATSLIALGHLVTLWGILYVQTIVNVSGMILFMTRCVALIAVPF